MPYAGFWGTLSAFKLAKNCRGFVTSPIFSLDTRKGDFGRVGCGKAFS